MSRTKRQRRIVELLTAHEVRSQGELSDLLLAEGTDVTQATLSRDLVEVGAVKVRRGRALVYAVPSEGGARRPQRRQPRVLGRQPRELASRQGRLAVLLARGRRERALDLADLVAAHFAAVHIPQRIRPSPARAVR